MLIPKRLQELRAHAPGALAPSVAGLDILDLDPLTLAVGSFFEWQALVSSSLQNYDTGAQPPSDWTRRGSTHAVEQGLTCLGVCGDKGRLEEMLLGCFGQCGLPDGHRKSAHICDAHFLMHTASKVAQVTAVSMIKAVDSMAPRPIPSVGFLAEANRWRVTSGRH
jgi:hypothetical protein